MTEYTKSTRMNLRVKERNTASKTNVGMFTWILKLTFLIVVIFGAALLYVYLNEKTNELNKEAIILRENIKKKEHENQVLLNRKAELSSPKNIRQKVIELGLGLRPASPRQIRRLTRYHYVNPTADPLEVTAMAHSTAEQPALKADDGYRVSSTHR